MGDRAGLQAGLPSRRVSSCPLTPVRWAAWIRGRFVGAGKASAQKMLLSALKPGWSTHLATCPVALPSLAQRAVHALVEVSKGREC